MNMVDFHTHILPHVDDGSQDLQVSEKMLKSLQEQGVDSVVLTPHFYTDRESLPSFLDRRALAVRELQPIADKLGLWIFPACEMYFTDYIFHYEDISELCLLQKKYLLIEFPFSCSFSDTIFQKLERLMAFQNVLPILAHIERYPPLLNLQRLARYVELGCLAQINLGGFRHSGFRQRKAILDGIRNGLIHLVGTDCHNMTSRPPDFLSGFQFIEKKAGTESAKTFMENARRILKCC